MSSPKLPRVSFDLQNSHPNHLDGLFVKWQPCGEVAIEDAVTDVSSLMEQALAVIDRESDDFNQPLWGAIQQLHMAKVLVDAIRQRGFSDLVRNAV